DYVDLVAIIAGRRVHRALAQIARVVDAAVGGSVYLDDVETGRSAPDALAAGANSARFAVGLLVLAVECHCEHASERRLARSAGSAQEVTMRHAIARDRASQRVRHVALNGHLGERARAVFPC